MENYLWEFDTSKEKVMLVKQGKHCAKFAGAAFAPSAADVCPAVVCHNPTEADSSPSCLMPGGVERVKCSTVLYPQQVKQTWHSQAVLRRTILLPSSNMLLRAEEV